MQHAPDFFPGLTWGRGGAGGFAFRRTPLPEGARVALGLTWSAHHRSQFHHGLIEVSRARLIQQRLCALPRILRGQISAGQPLQYAFYVAVHHCNWFGKRDAGDGGGGVAADSRQGLKSLGGFWKMAAMLFYYFLGALAEHAGAAVIAEAAPGGQYC